MNTEQVRTRLLKLKSELDGRVERTHKHFHGREEAVSPRFDEQIKETENDQLVHVLDQEGREELHMIDRALVRLDAGEYSSCSKCGNAIGDERLQAIPFTDLCIKCAQ